jgi:hypothetical protein
MTSSPLAFNIQNAFFNQAPTLRTPAGTPGGLISLILPNIIMVAGVIFFILILFGGFSMIVSAGKQSSPQEAARAKNALTYGVIGFLLVVTAYFILQIISTVFGINFDSPI